MDTQVGKDNNSSELQFDEMNLDASNGNTAQVLVLGARNASLGKMIDGQYKQFTLNNIYPNKKRLSVLAPQLHILLQYPQLPLGAAVYRRLLLVS